LKVRGGRREEKRVLSLGKAYFSSCSFIITPSASAAQRQIEELTLARSHNGLNHSKWRRVEKDLPKCLVIG
jgi:hypothetical protein